jgi:TRAP-type C4-dicarboxylate transport system permease small subunit
MIALCWVLVFKGSEFALMAGEITPFLQINKIYWYAAIPFCGCFMAVYSLISLARLLMDPSFEEHQEVITLG